MDTHAHQEKNTAALSSLWAALLLTSLKLGVGLYTNSLGILSEALHSGLDFLAAFMTFVAVRVASRPADANHPYGHGKVENLSALFETLLLVITSFWIIYEAIERLTGDGTEVLPSFWAVGVMLISIVVDINRSRMLRRVARKHNSQALEADALHFTTDIWSSAVVLFGVSAILLADHLPIDNETKLFLHNADAIAALLVSCIILKASYDMGRKAIDSLLDGGGQENREEVVAAVKGIPGILDVTSIRMRSSGFRQFVDLTIGVSPSLGVEGGHQLAHEAERCIAAIKPESDVTVHVEPRADLQYGKANPFLFICNIASRHALAVHSLHIQQREERLFAEFHVELNGSLPLDLAYEKVSALEAEIAAAFPGIECVTHIEPHHSQTDWPQRISLSEEDARHIEETVKVAVSSLDGICSCHHIESYSWDMDNAATCCVSFHCIMLTGSSVEEAHGYICALEKTLYRELPHVDRFVIHMEPEGVVEK